MRYYYKDPLAASWMSKHFGMKFSDGAHSFHVHVISGGIDEPRLYGIKHTEESKIFIHEVSLHLLEPKELDLVEAKFKDKSHAVVMWDNDTDLVADFGFGSTVKIIQRSGIPFHWPEVEA